MPESVELRQVGVFRAATLLAKTVLESGDVSLILKTTLPGVTATDIEKQFGTDFTAEALSLPVDQWSGPLRSGYGWHLVKVVGRIPGRIPDLAEVRGKVERDLLYETRQAAEEQSFQEIAGKYRITMNDGAKRMLQEEM